ncbi:MAG: AraC family transcriptional regulator, partial [Bacteroidota bacterium]
EIGQEFEVVFFIFPKRSLQAFSQENTYQTLIENIPFCLYHEISLAATAQLKEALQIDRHHNSLITEGKLLSTLGTIMDEFTSDRPIPQTKLNLHDVQRQLKVREILTQHIFGNAPNIDAIAQIVNISPSKLKADFKLLFDQSLYQYYLSQKMEAAKTLIKNREGTIAEIGHRLGYSNTAQFSAQFKKRFGVTPSGFRSLD